MHHILIRICDHLIHLFSTRSYHLVNWRIFASCFISTNSIRAIASRGSRGGGGGRGAGGAGGGRGGGGGGGARAPPPPPPPTCWARQIKSVVGFVFFRLGYFDYSDLQSYDIFISKVDFPRHISWQVLKVVFWSIQIWKFSGGGPPSKAVPSWLAITPPLTLQKT